MSKTTLNMLVGKEFELDLIDPEWHALMIETGACLPDFPLSDKIKNTILEFLKSVKTDTSKIVLPSIVNANFANSGWRFTWGDDGYYVTLGRTIEVEVDVPDGLTVICGDITWME